LGMRRSRKAPKGIRVRFEKPSKDVSERMSRIRSSRTGLERSMESLLRSQHIRYQRQPDLPGHPDFRVFGTNIVIFCDSSFWHGRRKKELDGSAFKKNREFWMTKLQQNRRRDARTNRALRKLGWRVLRFSDAEILKRPENVARTLVGEIGKHE